MNQWKASRGFGAALVIILVSRGLNETLWFATQKNAAFADWIRVHSLFAEPAFHILKFSISLLLAYLFAGRPSAGAFICDIGFSKRVSFSGWLSAWGAMGLGFLSLWFIQKGWSNENLPALKHSHAGDGVWLTYLVLTILLSPLTEEVVARGFLYRAFRGSFGWGPSTALVLAFQAYFHWGLLSQNMTGFGFVLASGALLCAIRECTGSTWNCVLFHVVYNATVLRQWWFAVVGMIILIPFCDRGLCTSKLREIHDPSPENT